MEKKCAGPYQQRRNKTPDNEKTRHKCRLFRVVWSNPLHRALALANERHHEYATLEHLLLALLDDQDAAAVMRACNVDLDKLRRSSPPTSNPSSRTGQRRQRGLKAHGRLPARDPAVP